MTACQFLPVTFLGPFGGVIVDRFDTRRLLIATQAAAGLLATLLGVLTVTGAVQLWMVFVVAVGLGMVAVVDTPARLTIVLELVGPELVSNAVTLNSINMNAARVVGPSLAAVTIALIGVGPCFLLNGASYIAVIVALIVLDRSTMLPKLITPRAKGQVREGLRYVWRTPTLRTPLLMMLRDRHAGLRVPGHPAGDGREHLPRRRRHLRRDDGGHGRGCRHRWAVRGGQEPPRRRGPGARLGRVRRRDRPARRLPHPARRRRCPRVRGRRQHHVPGPGQHHAAAQRRAADAGPGHGPVDGGLPGQHARSAAPSSASSASTSAPGGPWPPPRRRASAPPPSVRRASWITTRRATEAPAEAAPATG